MIKEPSKKFETGRAQLQARRSDDEQCQRLQQTSKRRTEPLYYILLYYILYYISLSLEKIVKDFNLTRSFKNVVNLKDTRRLPSASATTTTTSTTTTCCRSAASELPEALLRLFEA